MRVRSPRLRKLQALDRWIGLRPDCGPELKGCWHAASLSGTMGQMTDRVKVSTWVAAYEAAWRASGTAGLAEIFTVDAVYLHSPYGEPVVGLDAIRRMWDEDRDGPDEVFALATGILAVDGDTAVVRAEVRYGDPLRQEYRDLWVLRLDDDGRCRWFEEWPYWPGRPYSAPSLVPAQLGLLDVQEAPR